MDVKSVRTTVLFPVEYNLIRSSTGPTSQVPMPKVVPTKPYDWTYTTTYIGHEDARSTPASWRPADPNDPSDTIPMAELTRQDPILFYAEIPLFEDELHDNGASHLLVRIVSPLRQTLLRIYHHHVNMFPRESCRPVSLYSVALPCAWTKSSSGHTIPGYSTLSRLLRLG